MKKISYMVSHICWEGEEEIDPIDGESIVSNELDNRTARQRSFSTQKEAHSYIKRVKKQEGKWLAKITLKKIEATEIPI